MTSACLAFALRSIVIVASSKDAGIVLSSILATPACASLILPTDRYCVE
jgi:hypothetical protein